MQHSDKTIILNRIVKIICFAAIFCLINTIFRMACEHPETASADMIRGYSYTENLDAIVAGSSVAEMVNADKLNELVGCNAYNMCTPSQSYGITTDVVKLAASQNPIKKVYYFASMDAVERRYDNIPERTFEKVVNASHPLNRRIAKVIASRVRESLQPDKIRTEDSVNAYFTWTGNSVDTMSSAMSNLSGRMRDAFGGTGIGSDYREGFDTDNVLYEVKPIVITDRDEALLYGDLEYLKTLDFPDGMVEETALEDLNNLCIMCRENGIQLYMFISPHRSDYKARYDDNYENLDNYLKDFVENRGAIYYNFESDEDIHNKLPDEYFYDWEHVTADYVDEATTVIADRIKSIQN